MSTSHWTDFHRHWQRLKPPQRPHPDVVAGVRKLLRGHDVSLLLLGVTPELAGLGESLVAVDRNRTMIEHVWPGDGESRRALQGDWCALPFPAQRFSAALGDGSANCLAYPEDYRRLLAELARVLRPGGRLVLRVYTSPERPEAVERLRREALAGRVESLHGFKWRLVSAMLAEAGSCNIPVAAILERFDALFPDRSHLAEASGWPAEDIATIEGYRRSSEVYSFPTLDQFRAVLPPSFGDLRIASSGGYELAERCPLVTLDLA